MVKPELLEEVSITIVEAKAELDKVQARDTELNFRAGKCMEYFNDFGTLSVDQVLELKKKIQGAGISRLKEEHINKIIDMLPKTADEVKVIFQGNNLSLSKKDLTEIATLIQALVK